MQLFTNVLFTAQIKAIHPCPNKVCKIKFRKWRPVTYRGSLNNAVFGTTIQIRVIFKHLTKTRYSRNISVTFKKLVLCIWKMSKSAFFKDSLFCTDSINFIKWSELRKSTKSICTTIPFNFFYSFYTISWIAVCFSEYFIFHIKSQRPCLEFETMGAFQLFWSLLGGK